jgi:uncharacterized protein involved in response to NO
MSAKIAGVIPLQPARVEAPPALPPATGASPRLQRLRDAPHRIAFFAGGVMLALAAAWWGAALALRAAAVALPWAMSPSTAHALLMAFGFMPLFFAGFLFTAGPRWLALPPVAAQVLRRPVLVMLVGWGLALAGFHAQATLAAAGLALVGAGFARLCWRFARLLAQTEVADRDHARLALLGCTLSALAIVVAAAALALRSDGIARAAVHAALWGGIGLVFISVAHRMLPFFTASALPALDAWRPRALLFTLAGLLVAQAPLAAADALLAPADWPAAVLAARSAVEGAGGLLLLALALRWGLVQSLRVRLLAMLHMGFFWLGVAFVLLAVSHALMGLSAGEVSLGLAPLHAFTMGYLASTLLAMATRVVCGHSGRALVADDGAWAMFWTLQAAVVLRVGAALWPAAATPLTLAAALGFAVSVLAWALRYGRWLLLPRADGKPG